MRIIHNIPIIPMIYTHHTRHTHYVHIPITHVIHIMHIIHIILHIIHLIHVMNIIDIVYTIHDTHQLVSRFLICHPRHRDGIVAGIADDVTTGQKNCGVVRNQNDASFVFLKGAEATRKSVK